MSVLCPLICGNKFNDKEDLNYHMRYKCHKLMLIKDEFALCEADCYTLIKHRDKINHCKRCRNSILRNQPYVKLQN